MTAARYATVADVRTHAGFVDAFDDAQILDRIAAAERDIDSVCGRRFEQSTSVSARLFRPINSIVLHCDDISTTTGLIVATDDNDDGTAETTWTTADYELDPADGVGDDGATGWPYWRLRAIKTLRWPVGVERRTVSITAKWGWAAVPDPIHTATVLHAAWLLELRKAPLGIAGFGDLGVRTVRSNRAAMELIGPFAGSRLAVLA